MKNLRNTLMCAGLLLAAVLGINSCRKPSGEGTGVRFSARTFSSPLTKTEYSGVVDEDTNIERINWVSGDQITIACANCTPTSANYRVTDDITPEGAISTANALTPSGNGLQWGTGNHTFYAAYPAGSPTVTTEGVASATIPAYQGGTGTAKSSATSAGVTTESMVPDMSNAFMYAKQTASPGNNVELTFNPMFTAFQFTVGGDGTGDDYVTLNSVVLSSTSCALSGGFLLDIDDNTYDIPSVVTTDESANDKITYTFPTGTTINKNKQVRFTLFVQPSSNVTGNANLNGTAGVIKDLTIRFTLGDDTTRALKLKYDASTHGGAFVEFPGGKKINITGLTLPTQLNNWSFTVLNVNAWGSDTPDVLYGSPHVVDPGEGWIAETFAPDVSGMVEGEEYFYNISPGSFSVSDTLKVRFSPGNLQAVFADETTFTWQFAANQWDFVGANAANTSINGNGRVSDAGTVDLFCWSTSRTVYGIHKSTVNTYYSGDFVDWGGAVASAFGSDWRTLTSEEWDYLLNTRTGYRYCKARVNSVSGLVIFPDYYTHPSDVTDPASVNVENALYDSNSWSVEAWTKMEDAGCVFLPAAGERMGTSVDDGSSVYGFRGLYWSSTPTDDDTCASYLHFANAGVRPVYEINRCYGLSVRLVRNL